MLSEYEGGILSLSWDLFSHLYACYQCRLLIMMELMVNIWLAWSIGKPSLSNDVQRTIKMNLAFCEDIHTNEKGHHRSNYCRDAHNEYSLGHKLDYSLYQWCLIVGTWARLLYIVFSTSLALCSSHVMFPELFMPE